MQHKAISVGMQRSEKEKIQMKKNILGLYSRVSLILFFGAQANLYTACSHAIPYRMEQEIDGAVKMPLGILQHSHHILLDEQHMPDAVEDTSAIQRTENPLKKIDNQPFFKSDTRTETSRNQPDSIFWPIATGEPSVGNHGGMRKLKSPTSVIPQDYGNRTDTTRVVPPLQSESCATPSAKIYSEIAEKLAQPPPDATIFFVERTGVLVDASWAGLLEQRRKNLVNRGNVNVLIPPPGEQRYEDTVGHLDELALLSRSEACITHLQLSPEKPFWQQDMQAYLNKKGVCDDAYSSEVRIVEVQRNDIHNPLARWVIKAEPIPKECNNAQYQHSWRSILGELLAYKLSQRLELDLVPETHLILFLDTHGVRLGTAKPMLDNLSQEWGETAESKVQLAKAFCFIMGQWDLRLGNISMDGNGNPVLLDNECIVNLEPSEVLRVNDFGGLRTQKPFMYIGNAAVRVPDMGSQERPLQFNDTQFARLMGQYTSDRWWMGSDEKACEANKIVVKGNRVYKYFPTEQTLYMPSCSKDVLEIFACLNKNFVLSTASAVLDEMEFSIKTLLEKLCLSGGRIHIPMINDWESIEADLKERIEDLAAGVVKRKASFYAFHNDTLQPPTDSGFNNEKLSNICETLDGVHKNLP